MQKVEIIPEPGNYYVFVLNYETCNFRTILHEGTAEQCNFRATTYAERDGKQILYIGYYDGETYSYFSDYKLTDGTRTCGFGFTYADACTPIAHATNIQCYFGLEPLSMNTNKGMRWPVFNLQTVLDHWDLWHGGSGLGEKGIDGVYGDNTYNLVVKFRKYHPDVFSSGIYDDKISETMLEMLLSNYPHAYKFQQ